MSEIKYGLISKIDSACIEKTIDLICAGFPAETIAITEVGLFNCQTSQGIHDYILSKGRAAAMTGVDSEKDKLIHPPGWMKFIRGKSAEVYNKIPDNSQHFIFVDALHTFPAVVADFFCYKDKVKVGGYIGFHDTSPQAQGKDWQRVGSKDDPDMYISVKKALLAVGLINNEGDYINKQPGWELVFSEYDINDDAGGVCIFKKLY